MTAKTQRTTDSRRPLPWRARATYPIGRTRRARAAQYRQQTNVLLMTLLVVVVVGGLMIFFNWRGAGSTRSVSCAAYPQYCVPLAGGLSGGAGLASAEAEGSRTLDQASQGAPGVVRGFAADSTPFIGNPAAPIHFRVVSDFACSHCNGYHTDDLHRFVQDYVLAGQATLGLVLTTGTGGFYSELATQAALCAGEQGAFWEMTDEMFRLARSVGVQNGFTIARIKASANEMGLDGNRLVSCATSGRYASFLPRFATFANDNGVTGTPTLLVSYGDSGAWTRIEHINRGYDNMKAMTEAANAQ